MRLALEWLVRLPDLMRSQQGRQRFRQPWGVLRVRLTVGVVEVVAPGWEVRALWPSVARKLRRSVQTVLLPVLERPGLQQVRSCSRSMK